MFKVVGVKWTKVICGVLRCVNLNRGYFGKGVEIVIYYVLCCLLQVLINSHT